MAKVREEWVKISLDTTPVDRAKVQEILGRLYAVANKPAPKQIIHLDSPLQVLNAIAKLRLNRKPASAPTLAQIRYEAYLHVLGHFRTRYRDLVQYKASYMVRAQVREQICKLIRTTFSDQFFAYFIDTTTYQFVKQVRSRLNYHAAFIQGNGQAHSQIISQIRNLVLDQIYAEIDDQVRDLASVRIEIKHDGEVITPELLTIGSGIDILSPHISWYDSFSQLGFDASNLQPSLDLIKSCGWFVLTEDQAYISARPEYFKFDEQNRLHCETGAAVRYPDGFSVFAIHGVRVPEKIVLAPQSITASEIESEENTEVRRVMIERYGQKRYLKDSGAVEVHRDDFGVLYRKKLPGDEDLVMVKVLNSTPEPDGSFKDYFLRVPPTMERARQAVAWTFGKEEDEYAPAFQT